MKIVSWNVNGIRTRIVEIKEGKIISGTLCNLIEQEIPDIICFQETRCSNENGKKFKNELYPYQYFNESNGEGARGPNRYSGTAIWSKIEPKKLEFQIPNFLDTEGRIIIAHFENFILITVYVPNSGTNFEKRLLWNKEMLPYLNNLNGPVVFCGDMNVAYHPLDTYFDQTKIKPCAGILPEEKDFIKRLLECGYIDTFRAEHEKSSYTWWNPRCKKENGMSIMRNRDLGWRIDYFFTRGIDFQEESSYILKQFGEEHAGKSPLSSDHSPIIFNSSNFL